MFTLSGNFKQAYFWLCQDNDNKDDILVLSHHAILPVTIFPSKQLWNALGFLALLASFICASFSCDVVAYIYNAYWMSTIPKE